MNPRANKYRELNAIPASWGTAVNVQAMVFGNMGDTSATGVAFTRKPFHPARSASTASSWSTPRARTWWPASARRRTSPRPRASESGADKPSMETVMPQAYAELVAICDRLEAHYRDMQDLEFTIEKNKLWMLQTRNGKRTARAALKIACDLVEEGVIGEEEAIGRVEPQALDQLLHPTIDPKAERDLLASGLPASPGAASGEIVFTSEAAEAVKKAGRKCILVRVETSPEDIHGNARRRGDPPPPAAAH